MINTCFNTLYKIDYTNRFKNQLKKIIKENKDISELEGVIFALGNHKILDYKYQNHNLKNDKNYKNCKECHIKPDLLLIYKYVDNFLILESIGSHSELFR